jgi:hypothetical protein
MIVRRVTEALRRQDWAAVAIEFALVLVGVLLAFQINEWSSEREASAERRAATDRLLSEAEETVVYFDQASTQRTALVRDLSYALEQLQNRSWRQADQARMQNALTRSVYLASPAPPSAVYDDLVASGMLGKIGDPGVRSAIGAYRSNLALLTKLIDYIRQIAPKLDREESVRYVYDASGSRPARLEIDFAALEQDRKLLSSLALLNDRQWFILQTWNSTLAAAKRMCRDVARTLSKRCVENRVPAFVEPRQRP